MSDLNICDWTTVGKNDIFIVRQTILKMRCFNFEYFLKFYSK